MHIQERQYECVHKTFETHALGRPDAIALTCGEEDLSYGELNARANQLGHYLQALGVTTETRVAICVERSLEMVVAMLGILKAGGVYVPLDPEFPPQRLAFMLKDAAVSVLLTQEELLVQLPEFEQSIVCLDRDWPQIAKESREAVSSTVNVDNIAYIMYTSGSTGQPKGTAIPHRSIPGFIFGVDYVTWDAEQTLLQHSSVSWDALTLELWPALLCGGRCVLFTQRRSWIALKDVIESEGVTVLWLTAALFNAVVDEAPEVLCGVKQLMVGGEAVSLRHVRKAQELLPELRLVNGYGPSECTVFACCHVIGKEEQGNVPIGRPIGDRKVYVLDGQLKRVPVGVNGELYIAGASLARGYWQRAELTAERFIPHPYSADGGERLYRTGDVVRYRANGQLEFVGRVDDQVKVRGFRIELGEIENVLNEHPEIAECVVVVRADEAASEKRLAAYLVTEPASTLTLADLRSYLRERLPEYMVPAAFVMLEGLPLNANGKVDRLRLPAPDSSDSAAPEFVAPRTPVEETLAEIWRHVLKVDRIGIHENFFELGGDSILSIQVVSRAFQQGLHLTPKLVFQNQTIAELAQVVTTQGSSNVDQGEVTGEVLLTPIQHWFVAQKWTEPHHFNHSMMLEVKRIDREQLHAVVTHLLKHHDALRMRYQPGAAGWKQRNAGISEPHEIPVTVRDLMHLTQEEATVQIEREAEEAQRTINLEHGPLLRVVYFDLGSERAARLLIIVHHLVIDVVSWRILLEDLQLALDQLERGVGIQLPAKTTSFQEWAQRLNDYAQSERFTQEVDYWRTVDQQMQQQPRLPVNKPQTEHSSRGLVVKELSEDLTRGLLSEAGAAYHTQIQEVLLAALATTIAEWLGTRQVLVQMEGHGREELFEEVNLTRTVGWFTSLYPLVVDLSGIYGVPDTLQAVKEQMRAVPGRGIGYGIWKYLREGVEAQQRECEISFNYLGQFDQVLGAEEQSLKGAGESTGKGVSDTSQREQLLEICASVMGGALQMSWSYRTEEFERETIEELAEKYVQKLEEIVTHCRAEGAGGWTPSDFPLAQLDKQNLENLLAELSESAIESR